MRLPSKDILLKRKETLLHDNRDNTYDEDDDFLSDSGALSAVRWKNACIRTLRLRRHLKNGMCFKTKLVRDVAGPNIDIAAIDYDNGYIASATSKRKCSVLYFNST